MSKERDSINNILNILQLKYGFNISEIRIEPRFTSNDELRPDIIVYQKKNNKQIPTVVVEIKKVIHPLHRDELFRYMGIIGIRYGCLFDGKNFVFYEQINENRFIEIPDIPFRAQGDVPFTKTSLNVAANLSYKLTKIAWIISNKLSRFESPDPLKIISSLQKVLLCKIIDETSQDSDAIMYAVPPLIANNNDDPVQRINWLFDRVKDTYPDLFESNETLDLDNDIILNAIEELQSYSITRTDKKILRDAHESVISELTNNRFLSRYSLISSTPKPIVDFIIRLLEPSASDKIIDPFVGFGEFLISSLRYMENNSIDNAEGTSFRDSLLPMDKTIYGIERNRRVASIVKAGMIITGDYSRSNIISADPFLFSAEVQNSIHNFDVVVTKPPFGSRRKNEMRNRYPILYPGSYEDFQAVELALRFLNKHTGRMALILRESFLFSREVMALRKYIIERKLLKAIISLPTGVFPFSKGLKTSIIVLDNRFQEISRNKEHKVLMAEIPNIPGRNSNDTNLDIIGLKYKEFISNKLKEIDSDLNLFLIKASDLGTENWSVQANVPLVMEKEFGMKQVNLEEIADIIRGATPPASSRYIIYDINVRHDNKGETPYIRLSDITNGKISRENLKLVDEKQIRNVDRSKVKNNDILLSIRGTIGKIAIVDENFHNAIASSQIAILRIKQGQIDPEYLYCVLSSAYVQEQLQRYKTGSIISSLSLNDLKKVQVPLPTILEQKKIIEKMKALESEYDLAFRYSRKDLPARINSIIMESKDEHQS
jgi:type I restriction enzyme M protein